MRLRYWPCGHPLRVSLQCVHAAGMAGALRGGMGQMNVSPGTVWSGRNMQTVVGYLAYTAAAWSKAVLELTVGG